MKQQHPLFSWFYNTLLVGGAFLYLPRLFIHRKKYKEVLKGKIVPFKDFKVESQEKWVWIHAVSLGETRAIAPFAALFKQKHPDYKFIVTSGTATGHAEAKKSIPFAEVHAFLPFDFSFLIRPLVEKVKPAFIFLSEGDFWYHFLAAGKQVGAHTLVVNGKMSEKTLKVWKIFPSFSKKLFGLIDHFCVQSERYAKRLEELGIPLSKLSVTGNLKLDVEPKRLKPEELGEIRAKWGLTEQDRVLVAGSTHAGEEELMLDVFKKLSPAFPRLKLIIVPRHPERFNEVEKLLAHSPFKTAKLSLLENTKAPWQVLLVDKMGSLNLCYQLSHLAIVCGSYNSKVGGHNILEPCFFGKPVIFGPYMHTQLDLVDLVNEYQAGLQIASSQLSEKLHTLLSSNAEQQFLGGNGLKLLKALQGTTKKTLSIIEEKFPINL